MPPDQTDESDERRQRIGLADIIDRRSPEIVSRWLTQVRADADAAHVPLTELRNGIEDYLKRLAELLRGFETLASAGASAWEDVAGEHALTRVQLGFDVTQLLHELSVLRRTTAAVLREHGVLSDVRLLGQFTDLIEEATYASVRSYVEFRDRSAQRAEAEHIGFLTHELRNPLSVAAMAVSQLRRNRAGDDQQRLYGILDHSIDRIRRLIDDALLAGRLQAGAFECRPVETTFGELAGDTIDLFRRDAADKGLAFDVTFDPDLSLRADPNLLLSALQNLLENAVKYTDRGQVRLDVERRPGEIVVHVHDSCGGLSADELKVAFEPFRRVHTTKSGSGLGLGITRRAIEAQGGAVHARSEPGSGCHFWFTLPQK